MSEEVKKDSVESKKEEVKALPENVQVNDDGSISLSEGAAPTKKNVERLVGPGLRPDPKYKNKIVAKFINGIMLDGKKSTAERIVYKALEVIANKLKLDPLSVFVEAINNAKPVVEVKSRRVGGANYQVPIPVSGQRQQTLAFRWILSAVRSRRGRPTHEKLAQELMDCYNKTGATIQKRENTHKMAEANKAFSHFA